MGYSPNNNFRIGHINLHHSIVAHHQLDEDITDLNLQVISLSEPYFDGRNNIVGFPVKWKIHYKSVKLRATILTAQGVNNLFNIMNERDIVAVTFNLDREEIIFISVYLSPNEDITGNLLTLAALLTKHSDKKVIVAGDFNAKSRAWGPTTKARGKILLEFFAQHDIDVVNDPNGLPTYNSILCQSWVDLFIDNIKELAQYEVHDNISCSDHALITVGIDRSEIIQKTRQCNIKFERLDWLALRMKLRDIIEMHDLSLIEIPEQVENSIVRITEDVVNACNASKLKSVAGRRRHSSWWHPALGQMRRHVRALRRRYQRTMDDQERVKLRIEFKKQLSIYKKSIRKPKQLT
ncbi:uncharacterized protein [Parasteatoda tepidariorum]|uniref:uncharacterized protein n=1 Tax=Parasteatoda tepidariorum TaxID=114398 RepID=UPI001C71B07C|nr:uncharacterized protein LOC122272459 [Parasteatoda tepidariorum]